MPENPRQKQLHPRGAKHEAHRGWSLRNNGSRSGYIYFNGLEFPSHYKLSLCHYPKFLKMKNLYAARRVEYVRLRYIDRSFFIDNCSVLNRYWVETAHVCTGASDGSEGDRVGSNYPDVIFFNCPAQRSSRIRRVRAIVGARYSVFSDKQT